MISSICIRLEEGRTLGHGQIGRRRFEGLLRTVAVEDVERVDGHDGGEGRRRGWRGEL